MPKQAEQDNKQVNVLVNGDKSRPMVKWWELMSSLQEAGLTQVGLLNRFIKIRYEKISRATFKQNAIAQVLPSAFM